MSGADRIADYFVVVGLGKKPVAIDGADSADAYSQAGKENDDNEGSTRSRSSSQWRRGDFSDGKTIRLEPQNLRAVKSLHSMDTVFRAQILDRYPPADREDCSLSVATPMFCFPNGMKLSYECNLPQVFLFALTDELGQRSYCSCLRFFEPLSDELRGQVTLEETRQVYAPKCIAVLSRWPFFSSFRSFLAQIYRISLSPNSIPIERYICNFMDEVPLPPAGKVQVDVHVADRVVSVVRPPRNDLPLAQVDFSFAFTCLNLSNMITVVTALLLEQKVIFASNDLSVLSECTEVALSLLFPFYWQHVYIPLLPRPLVDFVEAPTPFFMGVTKSSLCASAVPDDVFYVDLDEDTIQGPLKELPSLPEKQRAKLVAGLEVLLKGKGGGGALHSRSPGDIFTIVPFEEGEDGEDKSTTIRRHFLRFFAALFVDYRHYLTMPNQTKGGHGVSEHFNVRGFLKSHQSSAAAFLEPFLNTNSFMKFLTDRANPSPHDYEILFFDETIDAKKNRSKRTVHKKETPFLSDKSFVIQKTFVVSHPSNAGLAEGEKYTYGEQFPRLTPSLYYHPRFVEPLTDDKVSAANQTESKLKLSRFAKFRLNSRKYNTHTKRGTVTDAFRKALRETVYDVWLILFTTLGLEGKGEKEGEKMLDEYGFAVLERMKKDGVDPDEGAYRALIEACGRFGLSARAVEVIDEMRRVGLRPDAMTYQSLVQAVAMHDDAVARHIAEGDEGEVESTPPPSALLRLVVADQCPHCNKTLNESAIREGWAADSNDYTVLCSHCQKRFVARFRAVIHPYSTSETVKEDSGGKGEPFTSTSVPTSTAGGTAVDGGGEVSAFGKGLYCECLSPLVLDKELFRFLGRGKEAEKKRESVGSASGSVVGMVGSMLGGGGMSAPSSPSVVSAIPEEEVADLSLTGGGSHDELEGGRGRAGSGSGQEEEEDSDGMSVYPQLSSTLDMLRQERPSIFFNLLWHFHNLSLPTDFMVVGEERWRGGGKGGSGSGSDGESRVGDGEGSGRRRKAIKVVVETSGGEEGGGGGSGGGAFKLMSLFTPRPNKA